MKALVLDDIGIINCKEVEKPEPKEGQVLLEVKACGICSSDIPRIFKTGTYSFPLTPGHEFSGIIIEVGKNVDTDMIGKHVAVFPLIPCKTCSACKRGWYALCNNYNYYGSRCNGAFAEYIAVDVWNTVEFDKKIPFKLAALCEPIAVAHNAISKINKDKTKNICIIGTGLIGIACGVLSKYYKLDVTFLTRNTYKDESLRKLGFKTLLDNNKIANKIETQKFDSVVECVGTSASLHNAIDFVTPKGQIVLVGNPDGDITINKQLYWKILRSEIQFEGIWNSNFKNDIDDWTKVLKILREDFFDFDNLITNIYSLADFTTAFSDFKDSSKQRIKGMFINE